MMRLLRVELNRFWTRRAVVLLLLLGALLAAGLAAQTAYETRPPTAAEISTAQAQAKLEAETDEVRATIVDCERDPTVYLPPGSTKADCAKRLGPSTASMLERKSLSLAGVLDQRGTKLAVLLLGLLAIAGATYAGADWSSDSLTNQLIFSPRRVALWSAKALAVLISSIVAAAVIMGGFWLAMTLVAQGRGHELSDATLSSIRWHAVRAVCLGAAGALGGYALTMLFRSTVATLGLLFAYGAGGELLTNLLPMEGTARWSVGNNIFGWLKPDFHYFDPSVGCAAFQDCNALKALGHLEAGTFLGALLLIAVIGSAVSFARRDV